jgi:RNA polymerase sigma-70 factor, ECF subfamily
MHMETLVLNDPMLLDQQALASIYERYSPPLYRYAVRLLDDRDLAEDCVAETFSRFLRAMKAGNGPSQNVQAYLFRIARNWITDQFRRQPPPDLDLDNQNVADPQLNPSHLVATQMERESVRKALLLLTPEQRDVVMLRFLEGWPHEEIAEALGKSVEASRALQARALASLRRILVEPED